LRASCCFPAEKKTRSIPPPNSHFGTVHTACRTPKWHGSVCLVRRMHWQDSQSSSESIVLTHLCASKMHSTPGQSMTCLWAQHHFLSLEPNSWQKQGKNKSTTNRTPCTLLSGRVRCDGCVTILPSTDCVRQWLSSALLRGTSSLPPSPFAVRQSRKKIWALNNIFSDPVGPDGWSPSYKSRRCTGY
jgi:hypothetical protein